MTATLQRLREIAPRILRLKAVLKQFEEGRRKLQQLHGTSEGRIRAEIEHALAVSQAAMEAKQRELQALESERARLLNQLPNEGWAD